MSFPDKVKSTLWSIVDAMAVNPAPFVKNPQKDFSRNRKLGFAQLVRFLLSMESGCLGHELLKFFGFDPHAVPSVPALIQQRAKLRPETFRYLLAQFNSKFALKTFRGKYLLIAADGSEFNISRNPQDLSTFHPSSGKSKRGFNMIHTISLFDLLSKRYLDVIVQPGREKNEFSALCQLMDRYAYGGIPIFVADRGFASYNVFAHAMEKGFYFAIRAKDINTRRLLVADVLPEKIDRWIEIILTRSNAKKKRLHPELESLYSYICRNITFDFINGTRPEYRMRLRIVRFQIAEGKFENIITNLPEEEFTAEQIKYIYNLRWGIMRISA